MSMRPLGPIFLLLLICSAPAVAAPAAELWPRWEAHDPASTVAVDHSAWSAFLARNLRPVDGINRIDYAAVSEADRAALNTYLARLAETDVDALSRAQQMALWINLYNALTVRMVLRNYPVDSIRDIGGLFSNPWRKKLFTLAGEELSLDDIEHRILRPIWRDPRIHYAVNCAALGCPNLAAEAYRADRLEQQLDRAARAFVNHPRGARFDGGRLVVSQIYEWYQGDFGDGAAGVIAHLRQHAEPELAARLQQADEIAAYRYDWALNDVRR